MFVFLRTVVRMVFRICEKSDHRSFYLCVNVAKRMLGSKIHILEDIVKLWKSGKSQISNILPL